MIGYGYGWVGWMIEEKGIKKVTPRILALAVGYFVVSFIQVSNSDGQVLVLGLKGRGEFTSEQVEFEVFVESSGQLDIELKL